MLTSLSFYFPDVKFLNLFLQRSAAWKNKSLTEFRFVGGHHIKFNALRVPEYVNLNFDLLSGQCLRFVNSDKKDDAIVKVLARCTAFHLDRHLLIRSLSEFGIDNMNKLEYCIISECPDLETVVDSKNGTEVVFPCLEHLSIHNLWSLTCIWEGVVPKGSFASLRTLALHAFEADLYSSGLKQTLKEISAEQDLWDNLVPEEKGILSDFQAIFTSIGESDV
ncbi:hypothetical protein PTKIN_Ptkin09bG0276900 [Pterospermum kingtungense]